MPTVIIHEPDITDAENEKRLNEIYEIGKKINHQVLNRLQNGEITKEWLNQKGVEVSRG